MCLYWYAYAGLATHWTEGMGEIPLSICSSQDSQSLDWPEW